MPATGAKRRFEMEYAINASPKILFPYIASASGLRNGFATTCVSTPTIASTWCGTSRATSPKSLPSAPAGVSAMCFWMRTSVRSTDANYLDFTLESSQITDEVFLRVTDYSEYLDEQEQQEQWEGLVEPAARAGRG
ncbi:MAG: START-like domain-containing protein [Hymenobacter sp.]